MVDSLFPMLQAMQQQFEQVTARNYCSFAKKEPLGNLNVGRQGRQARAKKEYDEDENEDDWVSLIN